VKIVASKVSGRPALAGKIKVRCSKGHVFGTIWSPLGSLTAIRLGGARFQHCPVGDHWALVRPVQDGAAWPDFARSIRSSVSSGPR
jgi:hypothetical protein